MGKFNAIVLAQKNTKKVKRPDFQTLKRMNDKNTDNRNYFNLRTHQISSEKNSLDMSSSTTPSSMNLSPFELARVVTNPCLLHHITDSFETNPLMMAILRHYAFLSDTIDELEQNLERHRREQEFTFDILNNDQDFLARIEPMVKRFT